METRKATHQKLKEILDDILTMGNMVEKSIINSVNALKDRDFAMAQQVINGDLEINSKRFEIEEKCIQYILTQQPTADDLRILIGVLNIVTELERVGDHSTGTAKIVVMIGNEPLLKPLIDIPIMAEKTADMLHRGLTAFINHDAHAARKIISEDDRIDNFYDQVFKELLIIMIEDPRTVTRATRLIWAAHNLERSADRITNICERAIATITGKMEEIGAS